MDGMAYTVFTDPAMVLLHISFLVHVILLDIEIDIVHSIALRLNNLLPFWLLSQWDPEGQLLRMS